MAQEVAQSGGHCVAAVNSKVQLDTDVVDIHRRQSNMQENSMDQPTSLSQLLRESYLAEARAHHRHGESSCIDSPRRLVYGTNQRESR
ncbi:hypothetical protein QQF64_006430 [Cirrhinus molitorella]|uniref:Uncharacterized protein n=1 Tax=Cirrhinus molitorella TaxID=172907 RepID=A0ABR3MF47_9TELE